ncbi:MAG: hypothetical protein A2X49_15625 [Lentisphaerae bacterium GWF2_52_8]|nr:MAG: hypothetical protein A2X49_15625 [Lentisphaerae bacterium GWF2_52_8]
MKAVHKQNSIFFFASPILAAIFLSLVCGCASRPSEEQIEARKQFQDSLREGDLVSLKATLAANKGLVNWRDGQGRTLLMQSLCEEKPEIAEWLAEQEKNTDALDNAGNSALLLAAGLGYADVVRVLLEKDAQVNTSNDAGRTVLMEAARHGDAELCGILLARKASVSAKDSSGRTALTWASLAPRNQVETATVLLAAGAEINSQNKLGGTPLMAASKEGNLELVRFLIEKGADPLIRDKEGLDAFIWAIRCGRVDVVRFFIEQTGAQVNPPDSSALSAARRAQMYEIPRFFLNLTTRRELTPLMWAVKESRFEVISLLIEKDADVNAETVDGKSVIDFAPDTGIRRLLEKHNAY